MTFSQLSLINSKHLDDFNTFFANEHMVVYGCPIY